MLIEKIHQHLTERNAERAAEHGPRERHYPSSACDCKRKLYYAFSGVGESNPIEPRSLAKMRYGDAVHDAFARLLADALAADGRQVEAEVAKVAEYPQLKRPVSGRLDILIDGRDGVEVKTTWGRGMDRITACGPDDRAQAQCQVYMDMFELASYTLVYLALDTGDSAEFTLTRDPEKMWGILADWAAVEVALDAEEVPGRDHWTPVKDGQVRRQVQKQKRLYRGDWQCSYCRYANLCWESELENTAGGGDNLGAVPEGKEGKEV